MNTYRPSGTVTITGLMKMLMVSLIGAVVLGGVAHFIGRFIYIMILFPLVMGFGAILAVSFGITTGKCRNFIAGIIVALITGAVSYGSMHFFDYLNFKNSMVNEMLQNGETTAEGEPVTKDMASNFINYYLQEETGSIGFIGYVKGNAKQGISIGKIGRNGGNIGEIGTWIYWAIELGAIMFIAAMAAGSTKNPFCEKCDVWYDESDLTRISESSGYDVIEALKEERFVDLPSKLELVTEAPCINISGSICPSCNETDAIITIAEVTLNDKGNESSSSIHSQMISMDNFKEVVKGIEEAKLKSPAEELAEEPVE